VYPMVHLQLVHLASSIDSYNSAAIDAFVDLKNECYSIYNYDVKLVFPALLSLSNPTESFKKLDAYSLLNLVKKKEEKIMLNYLEFKKKINPEAIGESEKEFFTLFERSFMIRHKNLAKSVKHWVAEKIRD